MVYAPVILCTLNRYEHFKRCIESLEKNAWAQFTEVFISLDYPPEEKYKEGHRKIAEYLHEKTWKFKEMHFFFQDENLGTALNYDFLREVAFEQFDRVISLEDDTEVSPNFLEFMDKALEYGKDDKNTFVVCGFSDILQKPRKMNGTAFKLCAFSWGAGVYRDKMLEMKKEISKQWFDNIVYNSKSMFKIFLKNGHVFHYLLNDYIIKKDSVFLSKSGQLLCIDMVYYVYMIVNNMYAILPTKSKIRNWGFDGTGQNSGEKEDMLPKRQEFDIDSKYEFIIETDRKTNRIIKHRWRAFRRESYWTIWKGLLYYLFLQFKKLVVKD